MTSKVDRDSGPYDCCKRATVLQHSSHLCADPKMNPSSSTTNLGALGQAARQALQNWLHMDTLNWPGPETLVTQLRWSCHLQQPDFEAAWHMRTRLRLRKTTIGPSAYVLEHRLGRLQSSPEFSQTWVLGVLLSGHENSKSPAGC